jgi:hypothetical protein
VIRRHLILLACVALVVPAAALAASQLGEGTLSVEDGRGRITLEARGGYIGRIAAGSITIYDLTPEDASDPIVFGDDRILLVGETGIRYGGTGLRFRMAGGRWRIVVQGRGIDLSAVGKGVGSIQSDGQAGPGIYTLDGVDCLKTPESCKPLPELKKVFLLGTTEKP